MPLGTHSSFTRYCLFSELILYLVVNSLCYHVVHLVILCINLIDDNDGIFMGRAGPARCNFFEISINSYDMSLKWKMVHFICKMILKNTDPHLIGVSLDVLEMLS